MSAPEEIVVWLNRIDNRTLVMGHIPPYPSTNWVRLTYRLTETGPVA